MPTFRYSRWDGSQQVFDLDGEDVMESLSDDILAQGDLNRALRSLLQLGLRDEQGQRVHGLRDLMERVRQQRQQQLASGSSRAPDSRPYQAALVLRTSQD